MGSVPRLDGEQTGREESMVRTRGAEMWMNRNALKERSASEESQGSPERVFFKKKVEEWERRLGSKRGRVASDAGVAERTEGLTKALVSTRRGDSARAGLDTGPDDAETLAQSGDTSMSDAEAVQFLFDVSASKEEEGFSSVDQFDPEAPERPVETDVTLMKIFGSGDALSDASRNGNNDGAGPVEEQQRTLEEGEGLTSRNGTRGPEESGEEKEEKVASNPRTLTPRKGALWKPNPAMHSDLTVQVRQMTTHLQILKYILVDFDR